MKLTNNQLRQIIKEELENVLNENKFRAEFRDDGVEVLQGTKSIMMVTKGQAEYYKPIAAAQSGNPQARQELAKQISQKVGYQVSPKDIEISKPDPRKDAVFGSF